MHVLFIHPNFPAQFRHVAPRLAADPSWTCSFVTNNESAPDLPGVRRVLYRPTSAAMPSVRRAARPFQNGVGHAEGVYEALKRRPDVRPDLVVAHSGFGSSLFLPHLYDAPIVNFFEYFYRPVGQDIGYRPEMPVTETLLLRARTRNAMSMLDLDNCDRGWCPNEYQRSLFPREYHAKIQVIPEGVDTELYRRRPDVKLRLPDGRELSPGPKVVTYVARGFEMMRGFDVFMKAAKRIAERMPDVVFVVVGSDRVCYGGDTGYVEEKSFREHVLRADSYDLGRFCFTGHVPGETLARILSVSDLHVYLTVPFVPSWSLLDAMSCSCVVLASDQACVREYVTHERNGLLCDFFDDERIAEQAVRVLSDPAQYRVLGTAARLTVEEEYSLDVTMPRIRDFFAEVAAKKREPSVLAEKLVRPGTLGGDSREAPPRRSGSARRVPAGRAASSPAPRRPRQRTVLFTWELGGGLGHMMQVLPLAERLVRRGYNVMVALRQLDRAASVFGRAGVSFLQAPAWVPGETGGDRIRKLETFTQLMVNIGFGREGEVSARGCAWRNLFKMARPDLVVFDHSPTALLASRGLPMRRALIGSGFCCPPSPQGAGGGGGGGAEPWGLFRAPLAAEDRERLLRVELDVLARVNRVLARWGQPGMHRLARLYGDVDDNFLTTFPELEQYHARPRGPLAHYWGPVLDDREGKTPQWPQASATGETARAGASRRVFAYLKGFGGLAGLLALLRARGCPTIAYVDAPEEVLRTVRPYQSPTLRFETQRLDMARVARECDVAILHAGQGATAAVLQAGKPILQIPLVLEQRLTAIATARLGATVSGPAAPEKLEEMEQRLDALLTEPRYAAAAARFGEKYAAFDPAGQVGRMVERVEELMGEKRQGDNGSRGRGAGRVGVFAG